MEFVPAPATSTTSAADAPMLAHADWVRMTAGSAHRVDSNVFIGGYLAAADPHFIKGAGITRIVKLFADTPEYPGGRHRHPGVQYFIADLADTPDEDIRGVAMAAVLFIQEAIRYNELLLVHCHAGISRSATIVLLHLMVNGGYQLELALGRLRFARPFVQPNPGFMEFLGATDLRLRRLRVGDEHRRISTYEASRPFVAPPPVLAGDCAGLR